MSTFTTDIVLGEKYKDTKTGFEGTATSVHFYEHACEQVSLKALVDGKIEQFFFDAPELQSVITGEVAKTKKPGGPVRATPPRG